MTTSTDKNSSHSDAGAAATERLRVVMYADAVVTGINGVVYVIGAGLLSRLIGPSPTIVVSVGAFLLVYAAIVAWIGRRRPISTRAVTCAIAMNLGWVIASLVVAAAGALDLTGWGRIWVVLQAGVVLGFACLQLVGIRRR